MNFYGTESTSEHTLAGRLIPLVEALARAVARAAKQPLSESKYSTQLPAWCHNICDQLTKTIFRNLIHVAPKPGKFDAQNYGCMAGMLPRAVSFIFKDAPTVLKRDGLLDLSPERERKIEKAAGIELLFPVASEQFQQPMTNEDELLAAGQGCTAFPDLDAHRGAGQSQLRLGWNRFWNRGACVVGWSGILLVGLPQSWPGESSYYRRSNGDLFWAVAVVVGLDGFQQSHRSAAADAPGLVAGGRAAQAAV